MILRAGSDAICFLRSDNAEGTATSSLALTGIIKLRCVPHGIQVTKTVQQTLKLSPRRFSKNHTDHFSDFSMLSSISIQEVTTEKVSTSHTTHALDCSRVDYRHMEAISIVAYTVPQNGELHGC